jgi:hypothetical protein
MATRDDDEIPTVRPAYRSGGKYKVERDDDYEERDIGDDPAMRLILPVGLSGWAIASGYLGLISVLLVPAPFAVLTGILAIREMSRNPKKHGMGRAIFGIVMGSLFSIGLVFGFIAILLSHK